MQYGLFRILVGEQVVLECPKRVPHDLLRITRDIGNNYNQTVKAIKNNFGEKRAYALLRNLEKTTIDLVVLSKRIIMLTHEFEETYLIKKQREEE